MLLCRWKSDKKSKQIQALEAELKSEAKKVVAKDKKLQKLKVMCERRRAALVRRAKRIDKLISKNKGFKKEIDAVSKSQQHGIQRQPIGNGPRAHLTPAAKSLFLDSMDAANMSPARWAALLKAIGNNLVDGKKIDLQGCSERTGRRLLHLEDMIALALESEELRKAAENNNLQLMTDGSPLLGRKS